MVDAGSEPMYAEKIRVPPLGRPRGWGQKVKLYLFLKVVMSYQIKADEAGSNMVANILPKDKSSTQEVGSKGQTISFSESSHVAYQIKRN